MKLTRRSFLKGVGGGLLYVALPKTSVAAPYKAVEQSFPRYIASLTKHPEKVTDVQFSFRINEFGMPEYEIFTIAKGELVQFKKKLDLRFINTMIKKDLGGSIKELSHKTVDVGKARDFRAHVFPCVPRGSFQAYFRLLPQEIPQISNDLVRVA